MKYKKIISISISSLILTGIIISCSDSGETSSNSSSSSNCPTKTCGDFATRAQAQAAYNSNKSCYKNLDSDGDGIACENLK
ncbi:excalibur calcium-binding domain-containing protein [Flavobacterium sp. 245]|uniref:excalibur calcium-binding domain-containing protein n=1 Tax=Flavobacterium sp. 245 TaxID=2512115 RepID=UPI00105BC41E|nr:excalibur calcium-binding domain-containing protein [Flavobacterium sp. 245]TDP02274.1 excalibur calcium-binding domain-containing protein [Flavobacterium sp. 245]